MVILMARGSQAFDEINKQKTEKNTNGGKPKFTWDSSFIFVQTPIFILSQIHSWPPVKDEGLQ